MRIGDWSTDLCSSDLPRLFCRVLRSAPCAPSGDLRIDVAQRRDHRWAALELPTGVDDSSIEVLEGFHHADLDVLLVQLGVEFEVLLAQRQCRRQDADLLALHELLEPPVGIVLLSSEEH